MKFKLLALLCVAALVLSMVGCSQEDKTTTLTGIVVSVEGTVVNLMDMRSIGSQGNGQSQRPSRGEQPQTPEGNFTMPEGMEWPEGNFTMPEGMERPEGNFTMPEGMEWPEGNFTMPEGMERPEGGFQRPEGTERPEGNFTKPEGAERPEGSQRPNFGNGSNTQIKTTAVDLKNAHIAIQDGDIKASGSISDIKTGSYLTITLNAKGEATEVLVGSTSGFGGFGGFGGNRGQNGNQGQGNRGQNGNQSQGNRGQNGNQSQDNRGQKGSAAASTEQTV